MIMTRDIVSNSWSTPMFVPNIGNAIRSFGDECRRKEPGNVLAQHPRDFELWHMGTYDDDTGKIEQFEQQKQLAVGANFDTAAEQAHGAKGEAITAERDEMRRDIHALREMLTAARQENLQLRAQVQDN